MMVSRALMTFESYGNGRSCHWVSDTDSVLIDVAVAYVSGWRVKALWMFVEER